MTTTTQAKMAKKAKQEAEIVSQNEANETVLQGILAKHGKPDRYIRGTVIPVFDNRYRVNLYSSVQTTSFMDQVSISASYFVKADAGGKILG